jgi:hypothetical protein
VAFSEYTRTDLDVATSAQKAICLKDNLICKLLEVSGKFQQLQMYKESQKALDAIDALNKIELPKADVYKPLASLLGL